MTHSDKFLGIDYGTRRIGVAISDDRGIFAFPKMILENDGNALKKIKKIAQEENAGTIVVGESLDFKGKANPVARAIHAFVSELERSGFRVHLEKEFWTSVEARRHLSYGGQARRLKSAIAKVDASAAALILQRYLDRKSKKGV